MGGRGTEWGKRQRKKGTNENYFPFSALGRMMLKWAENAEKNERNWIEICVEEGRCLYVVDNRRCDPQMFTTR